MIHESGSRRALAIALASFCVLLMAPTKLLAGPAPELDTPSTAVAPQPRSAGRQIKLAADYLAGRGVPQDPRQAAYWYEKAAEAGDPDAQLQTGYLYEAGLGVPRDPERAAHWYQLAAVGGSVQAKVSLGIAYLWATGVTRDEKMALSLLNEAAADGSGLAACYLGDFYAFGIGVLKDRQAAERWYRKGASLHNPLAEFDLATLLSGSANPATDLRAASSLFREAAAAGYVPAMHSLALLLVRNPGLARSPGEALGLLNDAANAGSWRSSMLLGVLARDGDQAPPDAEAAYYHFRIAALQGGSETAKLLEADLRSLSARLGPARTRTLDSQATAFFEKHHLALAFVYRGGEDPEFPAYALAFPEHGTHVVELLAAPPD